MEIIDFEEIKRKVKKYEFFDDKISINGQLYFLNKIIIDTYANLKVKNIVKCEVLDNNKAINITADFFKSLDINLYNGYLNFLYDKEITKIYNDNQHKSAYDDNKVCINFENNINDIFASCHEMIHKIFIPKYSIETYEDISKSFFEELHPIVFERLLINYTNYDYGIYLHNRMVKAEEYSLYLIFLDLLKKIYIKYKDINEELLDREIANIDNEFVKSEFKKWKNLILKFILKNNDIVFLVIFKYVVGVTLSATIFKKIKYGKMTYEEYIKKIKELYQISTYSEGLDVLDLNYMKDNNILKEIEEDYKKCYEELVEQRKR